MPRTPERAASDRQRRRGKRGSSEPVSWEAVDSDIVAGLVIAVTSQGGAVRFGLSRDGTALAVGILGDGEPYTEWFRPSDDIEGNLVDMTRRWTGEVEPS